ncbi:hypothetical protein BLSTO_01715 [Blastocystis sp. subtype 1]
MSARAFGSLPRQFAKSCRFQASGIPKMASRRWGKTETYFDFMKQVRKPVVSLPRSFDEMVVRCRTNEMQHLQIGALYMFSYVSKELLEEMESLKDMLSEEEMTTEEDVT